MPRKKKTEEPKPKETKVKVPEKKEIPVKEKKGYREFKDLNQEELDTILLYEEKVARMMGKYITEFDSKKIKEKYGNCIFPPFVLDMMAKVVKFS